MPTAHGWVYCDWPGLQFTSASTNIIGFTTATSGFGTTYEWRGCRWLEWPTASMSLATVTWHSQGAHQAHQEATSQIQRRTARTVAISRGEELLLSLLSEQQRESYRNEGVFEVLGSHGGVYRIHRGVSGNIEWRNNDQPGGWLCAHPTMAEQWLPTPDVALAQMLALTTDEREFVRTANLHRGRLPTHLTAHPDSLVVA